MLLEKEAKTELNFFYFYASYKTKLESFLF